MNIRLYIAIVKLLGSPIYKTLTRIMGGYSKKVLGLKQTTFFCYRVRKSLYFMGF